VGKLKTIDLTLDQGTALMRAAYGWKMPEKVGEKSFVPNVRANINRKFLRLFRVLKKKSNIWLEDQLLYFGPREGWVEKQRSLTDREKLAPGASEQVDKKSYTAKDHKKSIEVDLGNAAKDGLYWLLYLMSHPESKMCLGAGKQEEFVWDLVEKISATKPLEKEIGLTENETIEIEYEDAEPESDEDEKGEEEGSPVEEMAGATEGE